MIKILIGGSPCTKWSIAQKNDREVEPKGIGWELFWNYQIAKEKFQPDLFLYENNKSAAQPIKDQISRALGVKLMHINSARVSAQNRERFYAFNWSVEQPEDRGIVVRDILEKETTEKRYTLDPVSFSEKSVKSNMPICINSKSGRGGVDGIQPSLSDRIYSVDGKSAALTASYNTKIAVPVRIGTIENNLKNKSHDSKQYRVYSPDGKATTLCGQGGGVGAKGGLYATPVDAMGENVYEVRNGKTTMNGREYAVNLADGFYVIRKPTVIECCRLQTLPDNYCRAVSDNQARKGIGNGWTAEVIIHILNGALKDVPRDEEIVVLSMYDGIGTGRYCLDKMGFTNVTYYAYEIDKPAMKVALSNYPDIIQLGDAFNLRRDDWELGKLYDDAPPAPAERDLESEEPTDLSDAPEEIKVEIIKNDELLREREHEKQTTEEETMETNTNKESATIAENVIDFNAVGQLKRLANERKALADLKPDNTRFSDDVRAIEYAVSVLEAVGL